MGVKKKACEMCGVTIPPSAASRNSVRFCSSRCRARRYMVLAGSGYCARCGKGNDRHPTFRSCSGCTEKLNKSQRKRSAAKKLASLVVEKICSECGKTLPRSDFSVNLCATDGLSPACRNCIRNVSADGIRQCIACEATLPLSEFHVKSGYKPGRVRRCRACVSAGRLGVPPKLVRGLLDIQGGVCAICGGVNERSVLALDHCHSTGKVRGLLCTNCNLMLGNARDRTDILTSAIEYLQSHATPERHQEAA